MKNSMYVVDSEGNTGVIRNIDEEEKVFVQRSRYVNCIYNNKNELSPLHIAIDANEFEHLLNCMCNQKFINELSEQNRESTQKIIDDAYNKARRLLSSYVKGIE